MSTLRPRLLSSVKTANGYDGVSKEYLGYDGVRTEYLEL